MTTLAHKVLRGTPLPGDAAAKERSAVSELDVMRDMTPDDFSAYLAEVAKQQGRTRARQLKGQRGRAKMATEANGPVLDTRTPPDGLRVPDPASR